MKNKLSVEDIARITLLFINGDDVEYALLDQMGYSDYNFERFNRVKKVLLNVPYLEPALAVDAIVWQPYYENDHVGLPLIAGTSLPLEGCKRQMLSESVRSVLRTGQPCTLQKTGDIYSYYSKICNSSDEIVGVLELLVGLKEKKDVKCMDMFQPPFTLEEDDD